MRLIDADELLTAFPVDDEPTVTKSCIRMTIQHMPTIEPKQGEWISMCGNKQCDCSMCGERFDHTYEWIEQWNYCPNCGAKMKGE